MSQANLDQGLMRYFGDSEDEMQYGSVRLQPLAYQDDVLRGSKDVTTTQTGNTRLATMLKEKGLEAHKDKTFLLLLDQKNSKKISRRKLQKTH